MALTQEELLRQQQEKLAGIAQQQQMAQQRTPGQVVGETPEQFAAGKAAANSQAAGYNLFQQRQTVAAKPQPTQQPQSVVQQTAPVKTTPVVDPNSATSGMDAVIANMYTSPEQEEKMRKASVANQRILAIGDALRHIGNIYNTVNYAPSQQFNKPWEEEQTRYEKGKAVRDAANARYLSYQQAKVAQDAKQKQWEMDFQLKLGDAARKAGYTEAQIQNMKDRLAQQKAYQDAQIGLGKERNANTVRHQKVLEKQGQQRIGIASQNARNAETHRQWIRENKGKGSGAGVAPLDTPKGRITPNGRSYSNQLLQMFDYAKSKGYVQESDVAKRLREMGFGKDQSDNVKRQMVMDLLRTNQDMGDYAANRLGWSYGGGAPASDWEQYAEGEEDWSQYED